VTRRGRTVVRVVALLCAIGAAACLAVGLRDDEPAVASPADRPQSPAAATPMFSARRTPAMFLDAAARTRLAESLSGATSTANACAAVEAPNGTRLATAGTSEPLTPASNQKLLISAAALDLLGPDHRLVTKAVTDAPLDGGTLRGDLTLVGGGDPLLATPQYEAYMHTQSRFRDVQYTRLTEIADAIAAAGVQHVDGAIVADDSRYDTTRFNADWKSNYVPDGESGPLGALSVDGGFSDFRTPIAADDPALLTAQRLGELLADRGVSVGGGIQRGVAPGNARTIAEKPSLPLRDLVSEMLRTSDNYTAELVTREIGVAKGGAGSTPAGLAAVMTDLQRLGVPTEGVELVDGSGLAPSNRATCNALLGSLALTSRGPFDAITNGLPVAGQTGTLAARFLGDPLAGVLRAKTGEIDGVVGFSGTVDDNEHLRFSFLANGAFSTGGGRAMQAEIARIVAAYPDVSGLEQLVPAPQTPS
jgi:D-alanyl-D-alanine carboxypeptidase/D-alanyl-D-alanine-endopeptidase (penicillin-binding protein 4)